VAHGIESPFTATVATMERADPPETFDLRPAVPGDVDEIAQLWHRGWRDGHLGHVPETLLPYRTAASFRTRTAAHLTATTVAVVSSVPQRPLAGFVVVRSDEVEQLFVDAPWRGRGVAALLLEHAERAVAAHFPQAWLAVVAGNARARRFYERQGWRNDGEIAYAAETADGPVPIPTLRYVKSLTGASGKETAAPQ
jgi:GNAT superfamily N-acetyltransferase